VNPLLIASFCFSDSFGKQAAHGGKAIDLMLTANDDQTLERMLAAREGTIGANCLRDNKHRGGDNYKGPGFEPVKSSVSYTLRKMRVKV
jgi:hypothetical protein